MTFAHVIFLMIQGGTLALIVGLDRISKWWALALPMPLELEYGFWIYPTYNCGGAFSLGERFSSWFCGGSMILASLLLVAWLYTLFEYIVPISTHSLQTARILGPLRTLAHTLLPTGHIGGVLMVGGALGNLIDRWTYGHVIDFLTIHIGTWHMPICNGADIALVWGLCCSVAAMMPEQQ